jgi:hypothetical protein
MVAADLAVSGSSGPAAGIPVLTPLPGIAAATEACRLSGAGGLGTSPFFATQFLSQASRFPLVRTAPGQLIYGYTMYA